ncbi:MAG: hypothetical protein R6V40_04385, partial [Candidatus Moraniibacteriota bacterium]
MPPKQENNQKIKSKKTIIPLIVLSLLTLTALAFYFFSDPQARSAAYEWIQSDWSGGNTENIADHETDQTGWMEYQNKEEG